MFRPMFLTLLLAAPMAHAGDTDATKAPAPTAQSADAPEVFGAAMPAGDTQTLDAALAAFEPGKSEPAKFSGRIVDVCEKRGCWAMLEADGVSARVTPREHEFMVPRDVRGPAVVYGTLTSVDLSEASAKYAAEHPGKPNPVPLQEYRIDALSVVLYEQEG